MPERPSNPRRRNSLRHPGYDYTTTGAYFVTICTQRGRALFGQVIEHSMQLNPLGKIAHSSWQEFAARHPTVRLDAYIIMPNHVHALLWLTAGADPTRPKPADRQRQFGPPLAGSLSTLVGAYKSAVTQRAMRQGLLVDASLWQRSFHDRIVRGEEELARIRDYISSNPARWLDDQLHPNAPPNPFNQS